MWHFGTKGDGGVKIVEKNVTPFMGSPPLIKDFEHFMCSVYKPFVIDIRYK